jgi:WD40 repeat protein
MRSFVAFSPDRTWLVSASSDRIICIWDAGTGALVSGPSERLSKDLLAVRLESLDGRGIAISPDGTWVVTHSQVEPAKEIQIWNSETGLLEAVFDGHTDAVSAVAFSPDGTQIISCSNDKTIRVCTLVR